MRARTTEEIRRRGIVVLSDGEDTSSLELLRGRARPREARRGRSSTPSACARRRTPSDAGSTRRSTRCAASHSRPAAGSTSSRTSRQLAGIYARIADELSQQYSLGYSSKNVAPRRRLAPRPGQGAQRRRRRTDPHGLLRSQSTEMRPTGGRVFIIGAGPGDPGLMTARGVRLLAEADVVVYDRAVSSGAPLGAAGGRAHRRRRARGTGNGAGRDLHAARREGARRPHRRAPQVGRPVRLRQRRQGSALPARAGHPVRGRAGRPGGHRRAGVRGRAAHLSRRGRRAGAAARTRG